MPTPSREVQGTDPASVRCTDIRTLCDGLVQYPGVTRAGGHVDEAAAVVTVGQNIGAVLNQQSGQVYSPAINSAEQGGQAIVVFQIRLGATSEQISDKLEMTVPRGNCQRRHALFVLLIDLRGVVVQQRRNLCDVPGCGQVARCAHPSLQTRAPAFA